MTILPEASAQYLSDADILEDMMGTFMNTSNSFAQSTDRMNNRVYDISDAINEENEKIERLAVTIGELSSNMSQIQEYTAINEAVSVDLKKMKYKNLRRFKEWNSINRILFNLWWIVMYYDLASLH